MQYIDNLPYAGNSLVLTAGTLRSWRDNPELIVQSKHYMYLTTLIDRQGWELTVKYPHLILECDTFKAKYDLQSSKASITSKDSNYSTGSFITTYSNLIHRMQFFENEGQYTDLRKKFDVTIYSDASLKGRHSLGYAAWIKGTGYTKKITGHKVTEYKSTSTLAEMRAIIQAVRQVIHDRPNFRHILINTDAKFVNTILCYGMIATQSEYTEHLIRHHRYFLDMLDDRLITIRHVKAHTGGSDKRSYLNQWCDTNAGTQSDIAYRKYKNRRNAN